MGLIAGEEMINEKKSLSTLSLLIFIILILSIVPKVSAQEWKTPINTLLSRMGVNELCLFGNCYSSQLYLSPKSDAKAAKAAKINAGGDAPPIACGMSAPLCNGQCPPGQTCTQTSPSTCVCQVADIPCGQSWPQCNGYCPPNFVCSSNSLTQQCNCIQQGQNPPSPPSGGGSSGSATTTCGGQPYPYCSAGPCPSGQTCQADTQNGICQCLSDTNNNQVGTPLNSETIDQTFTEFTITPDCSNLPYGYDMIRIKIGESYNTRKLYGDLGTYPLRTITITSCYDESFDHPSGSTIAIPSEKKFVNADNEPNGKTMEIITGIKSHSKSPGSSYFPVSLIDELSETFADYYFYQKKLYSHNPFTNYGLVVYDPFQSLGNLNSDAPQIWGLSLPSTNFYVTGSTPILEFRNDNNKNYDSSIMIDDVPRTFSKMSDCINTGRYDYIDEDEPYKLEDFYSLTKIFDSYFTYYGGVYSSGGAYSSYCDTSIESYWGYDKLMIHYNPITNKFLSESKHPNTIETLNIKSDSIKTRNNYPKTDYVYNYYSVPFILKSGTNVIKATDKEIIILYSQKHQNRAEVTFGTIYDSNRQLPSYYSCVDTCLDKALSLSSICQPIIDCKNNCPITQSLQKESSACLKKISNYYSCQEKERKKYDKQKNPKQSEEEYVSNKCGNKEPCTLPKFVPDAGCASRCDEEVSLCKDYNTISKKTACQAKCTSMSAACSSVAFQVKIKKTNKWTKVTIPEKTSNVISAKEFFDCQDLKIKTLKGKKVGVDANYLEKGKTYAFKAKKACVAKYVPLACRPRAPESDAQTSDDVLEEPDDE